MEQSITITIKSVFGNELIYPVCENAKKFTSLTNKKTLDNKDLEMIKSLGFSIKLINAYSLGN